MRGGTQSCAITNVGGLLLISLMLVGGLLAFALLFTPPSSSAHTEGVPVACANDSAEFDSEFPEEGAYEETECGSRVSADPCDRERIDVGDQDSDGDEVDGDSLAEDCTSDPLAGICANVVDRVTGTPAHELADPETCVQASAEILQCSERQSDEPTSGLCRQSDTHGVNEDRGPP
jgi:hypothetical protein